ncbi:MAG: hypothetical protein LBU87_03120, partial [Lactobacillales bacterium]|nr:hypothetical protein [Lactobacillales bacterium]
WNQYTGKYHDTFKKQKSDLFPGILKLNPLFVMTTRDSSMACECANNGVNVGILDYFPGKIIETPSRKGNGRPDCRRFYTMMTRKKYLFDYNAFLKNNEKPVNNWSAQKRMPIALDDVILKLRHDFLENRRQT